MGTSPIVEITAEQRRKGFLALDAAGEIMHLPGIYVQRLVLNATPQKRIEHRTVRSA